MIWEEEEFEFDKEKRMKKYIKGELMSYYLLKSRWYELLDKKYFLYHKSPGGSIVRAPEGQCSKDGIQHQAAMNESAIAMEQEPLYQRMEKNQKLDGLLNRIAMQGDFGICDEVSM